MRHTFRLIFAVLIVMLVAACNGAETETPIETPTLAATPTPDPCAVENLPAEVDKLNKHMREFDDYSALASNTPQAQLVTVIPEMQRIVRETEDQVVPACLTDLKKLQIAHMKTVVQTLLAFIGSSDTSVVNAGITQARELHAQYDIEMARLLGVTLTVITPVVPTQPAPPTATPTPLVTNPGPNELNLRNAPDFNAPAIAVLPVGGSTLALGRTADSQWVQVQVPGQPDQNAWVYATVIELSTAIEALPVVTP